jgi:hypothetical protein
VLEAKGERIGKAVWFLNGINIKLIRGN